jgi:hypothetical protein
MYITRRRVPAVGEAAIELFGGGPAGIPPYSHVQPGRAR